MLSLEFGNVDRHTFECGRIPNALLSARWLKCSSVLRSEEIKSPAESTNRFFLLCQLCEIRRVPLVPRSPEAAVGSGHHVVEDVEGGLGFRSSAHPQFLQQHRLEHNSRSGPSPEPRE